ncbi:hypothetical protein DA2_2075 [Desulfovibrio sp. A2]|nr:hypothetical protein DA2_2075 [Desulfovibrio sp. A2]
MHMHCACSPPADGAQPFHRSRHGQGAVLRFFVPPCTRRYILLHARK